MSEMIQVPDGWEVKKVSDCILSKNDKSKQLNTTEYLDTGKYPIVDQSKNFIAGYTNEISKLINIEEPIVIFGDHTRELKYINFDFCCGADGTQLIKNKNFIDISFLFYALENIDLANYGYDRHFKHLKNSNILIPKEKKEQEKIAKILSTLDKSIEATNRLIEKEKNIKKALMQELLTNGIDKDGHIRTRATHTYKESKLGFIPDEWDVVSLKEVMTIQYGKDQKEVEVESGKFPILGSGGVIGYTNHFLYDKPSVLIGRKGTIDNPRYMDTPFWTVDTLFYSHIKSNSFPKWVFYIFQTINWRAYNEASGVPSLSTSNINSVKIKKPPKEEQKQIAKILITQDKKIQTEETNLVKLKELKKGLMNDLLSGKVRVVSD